ncbi:MAG: hypothetical protein ACREEM_53935 [Blastocatellia bacterium]
MMNDFYIYGVSDRRRLLADAGFSRDDLKIWSHPDGRTIGEGVATALTDAAFFRYLGIEPPDEMLTSAETEDLLEIG